MEQKDFLTPMPGQNILQNLPNSTGVLVLGILSILGSLCYGIGLICGIIALVLAAKDRRLYKEAPDLYSLASYGTTNAGRICAVVGIVLSSLVIIFFVLIILLSVFSSPQMFR